MRCQTWVGTFVRVHHAVPHGDRVIGLQLQGNVAHGLHQVGEEVGDLPAVLQQHVAILSVGEVRVAQVGPATREREAALGGTRERGPESVFEEGAGRRSNGRSAVTL